MSVAHNVVIDPLKPEHRPSESVGFVTGGNPLVEPETSKNLDLGIVVSPTTNVDVSADFYNIFLYKVIAPNATSQQIIDDPAAYPGQLVRSPNGTVVYADYTAGYGNIYGSAGILSQQNVASFDSVDLAGEYRGLKNWKFALSVVNLFNRYLPYDSAALLVFQAGPYDPPTYDDLGRMIDLHASYSF